MPPASSTIALLERLHAGEQEVVGEILQAHEDWLYALVRRNMRRDHRLFETSADVVQDTFRKLLEQGPRFLPQTEEQFRKLVGTMVLNHLRDQWRWARAGRRDRRREERPDSAAISRIGPAADSVHRPDRQAEHREQEALLDLALHLIDPEDAELIRLHKYEGADYGRIAEAFGIQRDAARMRVTRAVTRLGALAKRLRAGELEGLEHGEASE